MTRKWVYLGMLAGCCVLVWLTWPSEGKDAAARSTGQGSPPPAASGATFFGELPVRREPNSIVSMKADVERLSESKDPRDALKAFNLLRTCRDSRLEHRFWRARSDKKVQQNCGDITDAQIRDMGRNLDRALVAGVPGALHAQFIGGPPGRHLQDVVSNPDDPGNVEWKRAMYAALNADVRKTGDPAGLSLLSAAHETGAVFDKDPVLALAYHLALLEAYALSDDPRRREIATRAMAGPIWLKEGLTAEQLGAAAEVSKKIVASCCGKK